MKWLTQVSKVRLIPDVCKCASKLVELWLAVRLTN